MTTPSVDARIATALRSLADLFEERDALTAAGPDLPIGIDDVLARKLLGTTTRAWLERPANWKKVGGYKDAGHVQFLPSRLRAHVLRAQKRS